MSLTRKQIGQLYRPVGPKPIVLGGAWVGGGTLQYAQQVDLSLPIRGFRIVFKGRFVIGTAAMTSVNPEGLLNLISRIWIYGTNSRVGGNVTLYDMDLATLFGIQHLIAYRQGQADIAAAELAVPSLPFPSTYINGATGIYDFRFVIDMPIHPFYCSPGVRPGFLLRNEEWKDSLTILLQFGNQLTNSTGSLGVAAATTTLTFTGYGSGAGSPTIDVYSLPVVMGLDLKNSVLPGFCTRIAQPINNILQAAGNGVTLQNMQKQPTTRLFVKVGTSTVAPAFATLSDTNLTTLGVVLGGNRQVRNKVDLFAHKQDAVEIYSRDPIQGYTLIDFMQSDNPDSAYPADKITDGSTFQLVGDVAGVANGYGIIVQEQMLYRPEGQLYSF